MRSIFSRFGDLVSDNAGTIVRGAVLSIFGGLIAGLVACIGTSIEESVEDGGEADGA